MTAHCDKGPVIHLQYTIDTTCPCNCVYEKRFQTLMPMINFVYKPRVWYFL